MNKSYSDRNSVKMTRKGPFGRARRISASKFYENTLDKFLTRDYGKGFTSDKRNIGMGIFSTSLGNKLAQQLFLNNLPKVVLAQTSSLTLSDALGLRSHGWTIDRLIMRVRDQDYLMTHNNRVQHFSEPYIKAEKRLTPRDLATFIRADRILSEPSIISSFKTERQLNDMGYKLTRNASPDMTIEGIDYYGLTSCSLVQLDRKDELFAGYSLDNIRLTSAEPQVFGALADKLARSFHLKISRNDKQTPAVMFAGRPNIIARFISKINFTRARQRRLNTGVRDPILGKYRFFYNSTKLTSSAVADFIKCITNFMADEMYSELNSPFGKKYYQDIEMKEITSNMLAESMCRMGIVNDQDSKVLSSYFRTNTVRAILDLKDCDEPETLSALAEVYSVGIRRLANALNVDLKTFARLSNVPFDASTDQIFDDILCKRTSVNLNTNITDSSSNVDADKNSVATPKEIAKPTERAVSDKELGKFILKNLIDRQRKALPPHLPDAVAKKTPQPKAKEPSLEEVKANVIYLPQVPLSTYQPTEKFGFTGATIDDIEDLLYSKTNKSLLKIIDKNILRPSLQKIMDDADEEDLYNAQDDICAVVRKYKKLMSLGTLPKDKKDDAVYDFVRKIDSLIRKNSVSKEQLANVNKATNIYKLGQDMAQDMVAYRDKVYGRNEPMSTKALFDSYMQTHKGKDAVCDEVQSIVKNDIMNIKDNPEKTNN